MRGKRDFLTLSGIASRGPSNTIASPGVSAIMGGGTVTEKSATSFRPQTAAPVQMTQQQVDPSFNRYTNTFRSSAFTHTDYEPPVRPQTSAATLTQQQVGTSIEDYGRRGQAPETFKSDTFNPVIVRGGQEKVIKEPAPCSSCHNCLNRKHID